MSWQHFGNTVWRWKWPGSGTPDTPYAWYHAPSSPGVLICHRLAMVHASRLGAVWSFDWPGPRLYHLSNCSMNTVNSCRIAIIGKFCNMAYSLWSWSCVHSRFALLARHPGWHGWSYVDEEWRISTSTPSECRLPVHCCMCWSMLVPRLFFQNGTSMNGSRQSFSSSLVNSSDSGSWNSFRQRKRFLLEWLKRCQWWLRM